MADFHYYLTPPRLEVTQELTERCISNLTMRFFKVSCKDQCNLFLKKVYATPRLCRNQS